MLTFIKNCAISVLYCMSILFIGYAFALAAAPSALGLSLITAKSLLGWTALSAALGGAAYTYTTK